MIKWLQDIKFNFINVLATLIVMGIFIYYIMSHGRAETTRSARIDGTMDALLIMVAGYYFGSSRSSAKKDETIQQITEQNQA